ncbi:ISL3 family transposase [Streptococcus varani]|nr:ISL3 family transposase [Streptococcus varani]
MEQFDFITNLLGIKDPNITISDYVDAGTHKEVIAKLDYPAPKCHNCHGQMAKYDLQKESKIPYLECAGYKTLIRLRKRRFRCQDCGKIAVAETSLVKKNHQIPAIVNHKIAQKLIEKASMTDIAECLAVSTSTVIRKLKEFQFKTDLTWLPAHMSWDEYSFKKGKMSFIAQDFDSLTILAILDGRTQTTIRNHFLRYSRQVRNRVKVITMDMFSPYYDIAKKLFPNAKIVLDRFHIVQHMSRAMNHLRIQIMKQFDRKSHEYKALKSYWKLIQQDSRKLSDKRFYRPTFRMHLTNKEILKKLLSYSQELREHYELYQLLLFHFQKKQAEHFFDRKSHEYKALKSYWKLIQQDSRKLSDKRFYRPTFRMHLTNKEILKKLLSYSQELREHYELYQLLLFHFQKKQAEHFFDLIEELLPSVNPIFQTIFKTFLKDKDKIINALELPYSNAKLDATNNLIKVIKRNAFGFRNFDNFKLRILIALNIKKKRTKLVLSRL